ncbi:unnamed protein product [Pleuronectes platessa]|uniref:Uncharacterized protein n=1 Tax=Pleuronectes platessa TaxID=8262 RepID=A0A9N7YC81_PLEPL|nr:unnamed protein product [Pleuronectes platessa]
MSQDETKQLVPLEDGRREFLQQKGQKVWFSLKKGVVRDEWGDFVPACGFNCQTGKKRDGDKCKVTTCCHTNIMQENEGTEWLFVKGSQENGVPADINRIFFLGLMQLNPAVILKVKSKASPGVTLM